MLTIPQDIYVYKEYLIKYLAGPVATNLLPTALYTQENIAKISFIYVTGSEITRLPRTQQQVILFTITR